MADIKQTKRDYQELNRILETLIEKANGIVGVMQIMASVTNESGFAVERTREQLKSLGNQYSDITTKVETYRNALTRVMEVDQAAMTNARGGNAYKSGSPMGAAYQLPYRTDDPQQHATKFETEYTKRATEARNTLTAQAKEVQAILIKSEKDYQSLLVETQNIISSGVQKSKALYQSEIDARLAGLGQVSQATKAYRPPQDAFAAIQEGLAEASARGARIEQIPSQGNIPDDDLSGWLGELEKSEQLQEQLVSKMGANYDRLLNDMANFSAKSTDLENKTNRRLEREIERRSKQNERQKKSSPVEIDIDAQAQKFPEVTKAIEEYGLKMEHLKSVSTEVSTGISTLNFATQEADGTFRKLNVTVDQNGKILQDSQKRFRGFASTIGRNITEALKWSIAIQLVWGPLKKLNELVEIMIANESKLADITVAVGQGQDSLNKIFETASDVALLTGESINGVLEGYELAIRATGGIEDANERLRASQTLLTDSMILSKLSALDQAEALDILVGGLSQLGLGFDKGITLIDNWVALSKRANVSIETLATSFSIASASAEGAGLEMKETNAIIAIIAENTGLSAKETGNAFRAMVSGFQTDTAIQELGQYGIAVETLTEGNRGFIAILLQIKELFDEGLISPTELTRISQTLGGGNRRGSQIEATIKDLDKLNAMVSAQEGAEGSAQSALSIKLETVETKVIGVSNAFQELGESLGTDGGLLDVLKTLLDVGTGIVNIFTSVSEALGTSLPKLIAFGAIVGQLNKLSQNGIRPNTNLFGIAGALGLGGGPKIGLGSSLEDINKARDSKYSRNIQVGKPGMAFGIAAAGIDIAGNLAKQDFEAAGGNFVGAVLGGLATGGNPIGIAIGSAIGNSFVDNILRHESDFDAFFKEVYPKPPGEDDADKPTDLQDKIDKLEDEIFNKSGEVAAFASQASFNTSTFFSNIFKPEEEDVGYISKQQGAMTTLGLRQQLAGGSPIPPEVKKLMELRKAQEIEEKGPGESIISKEHIALAKEYGPLLDGISDSFSELNYQALSSGEISTKAFKDAQGSIDKLPLSLAGYASVFGDELVIASGYVDSFRDSFNELAFVISNSTAEEVGEINKLLGSILDLKAEGGDTSALEAAAAGRVAARGVQIRKDKYSETPSVDFGGTSKELDTVLNLSKGKFSEFFAAEEREGLTQGLAQADLISEMEPFFVYLEDEMRYVLVRGVEQSLFKEAIADATEDGIIAGAEKGLGLVSYSDYTSEQVQSLAAQSVVGDADLVQKYGDLGYESGVETFIAATSSGFELVTGNQFILNMLMKDLIDVNEKQLEGIYNLPTDASFFVPFTGYALGQSEGGGGGGSGGANISVKDAPETGIKSLDFAKQREMIHDSIVELRQEKLITTPEQGEYSQERKMTKYEQYRLGLLGDSGRDLPYNRMGAQGGPYEEQSIPKSITEPLNNIFGPIGKFLRELFSGPGENAGWSNAAGMQGLDDPNKESDVVKEQMRMADRLIRQEKLASLADPPPESGERGRREEESGRKQPMRDWEAYLERKQNRTGDRSEADFGDKIDRIFSPLLNLFNKIFSGGSEGFGLTSGMQGADDLTNLSREVDKTQRQIIETNFNLSIQSKTELLLDGQVVANVVKNYLLDEMISQENRSTAVTRSVVI